MTVFIGRTRQWQALKAIFQKVSSKKLKDLRDKVKEFYGKKPLVRYIAALPF